MQKGIKMFGEKGSMSAIKEIFNLTVKNDYFGGHFMMNYPKRLKIRSYPF